MRSNLHINLCLLFFFFSLPLFSLHHQTPISAFEHLAEVNAQWLKYENLAPAQAVSFATDIDRIQYHLLLVEKQLRKATPSLLSKSAAENRAKLLDVLKKYAESKTFPTNTYHNQRTPYFIDDFGVHCAVGFLIAASGNTNIAQQIKKDHNYNYLRDIKTAGVAEWATDHGFTLDELAWIQPGYDSKTKFYPLPGSPNGHVKGMTTAFYNKILVLHGTFDSLNNNPCLNIGAYNGNQFECLGGGIKGEISALHGNHILISVAGKLEHEGKIYPMAGFVDSNWTFIEIPGRENAIGTAIFHYSLEHFYVAIEPESKPGINEVWTYHEKQWRKRATFHGRVNDLYMDQQSIYAGAFNLVEYHNIDKPDTIFTANNILYVQRKNFLTFDEQEVSDTVLVIEKIGNAFYFGGTCSGMLNSGKICLTKLFNDKLQPIATRNNFYANQAKSFVSDVTLLGNNELYIAGHFADYPFIGTYTKNLSSFNLALNTFTPKGSFDESVFAVANYKGDIYVGGEFSRSLGRDEHYKYMAKMESPLSIKDENNLNNNFSLYPNPAQTSITIQTEDQTQFRSIQIVDILGRSVIRPTQVLNQPQKTIDVSGLKNGLYVLVAETANGQLRKTFEVSR